MRYVQARIAKSEFDLAYRFYVTDALKIISQNTAKQGGEYLSVSFRELVKPVPEDKRSADDVIQHIKQSLRGLQDEST